MLFKSMTQTNPLKDCVDCQKLGETVNGRCLHNYSLNKSENTVTYLTKLQPQQ